MNIPNKMVLSAFKTSAVFALANMGASFVDGLVTSHFLGSAEMAAVGLASPFFTITSALCTCIGTGLIALCANNLGSGDKQKLNKYFNSGLWAMLAVSIILMAIFLFCAEPISALFGARGNGSALLKGSSAYIRGLALGLPSFLLSGVISSAIQMDGGGNLVKLSAVACLITDGVFDVLAVWFGWGLFGIGLATSVSTAVKLGILFLHFLKKNTGAIRLKFMLPEISCLLDMLKSGSDTLILSAANIIKPIFLNSMIISVGGNEALSVLSVYNNLTGLTTVICTGLASALSITVGVFYGECNRQDIVHIARFVQKLVLILYAPVIFVVIVFCRQISQYYLPDLADNQLMIFALFGLSFCMITYSMLFLRIRYLQTIKLRHKAQLLTFGVNFIGVIICAYLASLLFGAYGIIAANAISSVLCILTIILLTQIRSRKFFVKGNDYLCLPGEFYGIQEAYTCVSIKKSDTIDKAVSVLTDFCKNHSGNSQILSILLSCMMKIAGFRAEETGVGKKAYLDMSITAEIRDNSCRLILRDNGPDLGRTESSYQETLKDIVTVPYTIKVHRTLEYNSVILEINSI